MAKSIIKELIIVLLLCLAIILVLGILLYDYVPVATTVPNPVAYTTPEDIKEELLTSEQVEESEIIMTYEINSDDLNNYKRIQDYKPGKANPFSSYETQSPSGETETGKTNTGETSNNTSNTTTSGGKYFQDKGTK